MYVDKLTDIEFDESFIRANRAAMFRRARSIVKNDADAEDAVQEALERAWRSRERFLPGSNPRPWLLTITKNVALDMLEHRQRMSGEISEPAGEPGEAPERSALRRETARSIGVAVQNLNSPYRTVFVLHDLHGYSSREISLRERVPYHTVRTHLFRARRELRRALTGVES